MGEVRRKLVVVLAADVAEYSRHVREDEEGSIATLRGHRELIDALIARHGGRIANTAGDSVLAEFASPVEAVRCAIEIQEGLRGRNAELPERRRMWLRIGINLGDVMVQESGDLLGDGVNVAARVQAIAEPGGICIASNVREQVENKVALVFDDLGAQRVKNIPQPVRVFRLRAGEGAARRFPPALARRMPLVALAAVAIVGAAIGIRYSGALLGGATAYDGTWEGPYTCEARGRLPRGTQMRVAVVRNGALTMSRGKADEADSFDIEGTVARDGRISLSGHGVGPVGPYTIELTGKATAEVMTLNGFHNGVRACTATLKRTSS